MGKIHSSSLTSIQLTLLWDPPVCLYKIPSIVRVLFVLLVLSIYSSYSSLLRVNRIYTTTTFADARHYLLTRSNRWRDLNGELNGGKIHEQYKEPSNILTGSGRGEMTKLGLRLKTRYLSLVAKLGLKGLVRATAHVGNCMVTVVMY